MLVKCKNCKCVNNLTELNVNVGHVFDCAECTLPLRTRQIADKLIGVPVSEDPKPILPEIPKTGIGARSRRESPNG